MIDVTCAICKRVSHADDVHEGKSLRCPECGGIVPIIRKGALITDADQSAAPRVTPIPRSDWHPATKKPGGRSWPIASGVLVLLITVAILAGWFYRSPKHEAASASPDAPSASPQPAAPESNSDFDPVKNGATPHVDSDSGGSASYAIESPAVHASPAVRLQNGARLTEDARHDGHGILILKNGNDQDAVVRVVDEGTDNTANWVYVRARNNVEIDGVSPARYRLIFTLGTDWNDGETRFNQDASYQRMDRPIVFTEQETEHGIGYDRHTVTLNPVPLGNIGVQYVSAAEFANGRNHAILTH